MTTFETDGVGSQIKSTVPSSTTASSGVVDVRLHEEDTTGHPRPSEDHVITSTSNDHLSALKGKERANRRQHHHRRKAKQALSLSNEHNASKDGPSEYDDPDMVVLANRPGAIPVTGCSGSLEPQSPNGPHEHLELILRDQETTTMLVVATQLVTDDGGGYDKEFDQDLEHRIQNEVASRLLTNQPQLVVAAAVKPDNAKLHCLKVLILPCLLIMGGVLGSIIYAVRPVKDSELFVGMSNVLDLCDFLTPWNVVS